MSSIELFFSYAHTDEPLLLELRKHLAALERAQLIQGWFDRRIEPGAEWAAEIQAAMDRASIILLLISSDFIASKYCFTVEMPRAMERHKLGALVIPVVLRPVYWQDLPVSALQALPTGARPVTSWPNSDEAFRDIAEHLREMILTRRMKEIPARASMLETVSADRVLDAAVPSTVALDEPTQLVTMIRRVGSAGLKAVLQVSTTFAVTPEDVQSKTFEVEFPVDAAGKTLPAALELLLESPGCDPPRNSKKLRVPPSGDSDICVFLFTPKKIGHLVFNLEVRYEEVELGSQFLVSTATGAAGANQPLSTYSLATLPLSSTTFIYGMRAMAAAAAEPKTASPLPPPAHYADSLPTVPSAAALAAATSKSGRAPIEEPRKTTSSPPALPPPPSLGAGRAASSKPDSGGVPSPIAIGNQSSAQPARSWLTKPMMTFASAAAVLVVAGLTLVNYRSANAPVPNQQLPAVGEPNPSSGGRASPGSKPSPTPQASAPTAPAGSSAAPGASPPPPPQTDTNTAVDDYAAVPTPPPPAPEAIKAMPAFQLALAAVERKDYDSAVNYLTEALRKQPNNAELYWRRSEAYRALSEPDSAMADVDRALAIAPDDAYAHVLKGELLRDEALQAHAAEAPALHKRSLAEYKKAQAAPNLSAENRKFVDGRIKTAIRESTRR